jgi:hypothetical protein
MSLRRPAHRTLQARPPSLRTGPLRTGWMLLVVCVTSLTLGLLGATSAQADTLSPDTLSPDALSTTTPSPTSASTTTAPRFLRSCAAVTAAYSSCFALRRTDVTQPAGMQPLGMTPDVAPAGFGAGNLQSAYNLPSASAGAGQTVAIVDAFNQPNADADLAVYRAQYGLPPCTMASGCFQKVNQNGAASPLPSNSRAWSDEITLDLDMVSAICPNCKILLVEATNSGNANLYAAVNRAVTMGAKFVSVSWGNSEYASQTTDDTVFNHPGVAITVSSGDDGAGPKYPATSKYVTAVGGTTLTTAANPRGWTETAWAGAGSGCSAYDAKPTWQTPTTGCANRATADVSAVADPATGVAVYQTYGAAGWEVYGGTSVASPIIASTYALAGIPAATADAPSFPYASPGALNDVISGTNGTCGAPMCTAGAGWDGPTGLGTPNGTAAFAAAVAPPPNTVTVTNPGAQIATVGTAFSLQINATDSAASQTLSYTATGLPAGLTLNPTTGLITGTPTTAGTSSATVTATDTTSAHDSATFSIVVSPAVPVCVGSQLLGNPGFETGTAPPWTTTTGVVTNAAGQTSHGGSYFAWLDGYGSAHTDTLAQSVTIPAACSGTTLSFWLKVGSAETSTTAVFDQLTVKIGSTVLATYSNLDRGAYAQKTLSLAAYAGQTVTVTFTGTEDASLQTSFVIDDTAVTTS